MEKQIRAYQETEAVEVGRLIADTYGKYNLGFASPEDRKKFLGPFYYARSDEPAHREAIADAISAPMVYVGVVDGRIVGVLRGSKGRLHSLFVHGDYHQHGVGRLLVDKFETECTAEGVESITLAATLEAVAFYTAVGYRKSTGLRSMKIFEGSGFRYQPMKKVL